MESQNRRHPECCSDKTARKIRLLDIVKIHATQDDQRLNSLQMSRSKDLEIQVLSCSLIEDEVDSVFRFVRCSAAHGEN